MAKPKTYLVTFVYRNTPNTSSVGGVDEASANDVLRAFQNGEPLFTVESPRSYLSVRLTECAAVTLHRDD